MKATLTSCLALGACAGAPAAQRARHLAREPITTVAAIDPVAAASDAIPSAAVNDATPVDVSGPARRVLEVAERMANEGVVVRGSCYRYIDTVFTEAGYDGWRRQSNVFRGPRSGPYADLDLIQPGDWLYIVNHPEARPMGTHSVLFARWQDRAAGIAWVYSYVGGGRERSADYVTYDVSRTYAIRRAIDEAPR